MSGSAEVLAWIATLKQQDRSLSKRNRFLAVVFGAALVLAFAVSLSVYRWTVGSYASLDNVRIVRQPASQGRIEIAFDVRSPGRVRYLRTSGAHRTELVDYFVHPGSVERSWSWSYEPGRPIDVSLTSRRGFWRRTLTTPFSTCTSADIVILVDSTGSMSPSLEELQARCGSFSQQLTRQALPHRFALIGFGDMADGEWLDAGDFTSDVDQFRSQVAAISRYDGGDLPESALDAIEAALKLPFDQSAMRRFYLVTDASFHEPAASGATAADIARALEQARVHLEVFSRPEFEKDYQVLLGKSGNFREVENFGKALEEGRVLED
ncbi:MAG: vWA domain-containing protein [Thermoguttaceae bacterium]